MNQEKEEDDEDDHDLELIACQNIKRNRPDIGEM